MKKDRTESINVYRANGIKTRRFEPRLVRREDVEDLLTTLLSMTKQLKTQLNIKQCESWLVTHAQNIMTEGTYMHKELILQRDKIDKCV